MSTGALTWDVGVPSRGLTAEPIDKFWSHFIQGQNKQYELQNHILINNEPSKQKGFHYIISSSAVVAISV